MVLQYGIKLAIKLISLHFGDLVSKVCDCLLHKGSLTLSEVIRYTELPPQQVKNCLIVLIQHNCVQAFNLEKQGGLDGASRVVTHYTSIFENILHRMRFSKFLLIVFKELGKECEELLKGLLEHGRLTLEHIILRAVADQSEGSVTIQDNLRANFAKLVNAHYVERCPASVPIIKLEENSSSPAKKGSKAAKLAKIVTVEQKAMRAAALSEAERFSVIADTGADVTSGEPLNVMVGEKRKHGELEINEGIEATICEKEVLWRANFEEFVRVLRNKACVANVRSLLDDGAGVTLNAILEAKRSSEEKVKIDHTVPLSIDAIFEEVIKSEEGRSMTFEHVRAALGQLGCNPIIGETEESYSVDLKNIIEMAQIVEVESVVLKKYGRDAYSMFRLLLKAGCLMESDKISDATFVEKKVGRAILYNLWKDDYLQMQKFGQGPQIQFLLWKVNTSSLKEYILNDMYHAVLNLTLRNAHELEKEREIVQLPIEKRVGAQGKRFDRIKKVKVLLDSSLMKLNDVLMLFHDF